MPQTLTVRVWMARPGHEDTPQGILSLDQSALWFEGGGTTIQIPAADITKVRRARGSPVITVTWLAEGERRETSFYFAEPGPIEVSAEPPWMPGRGLDRTISLMRLRAANKELKPVVKEWAAAIRRLAKELGGSG
jgi:hypothetical protein